MREALDRMRPLASDALLAMFQIAMGEATEKAGERTLRNAARRREPNAANAGAERSVGSSRRS